MSQHIALLKIFQPQRIVFSNAESKSLPVWRSDKKIKHFHPQNLIKERAESPALIRRSDSRHGMMGGRWAALFRQQSSASSEAGPSSSSPEHPKIGIGGLRQSSFSRKAASTSHEKEKEKAGAAENVKII